MMKKGWNKLLIFAFAIVTFLTTMGISQSVAAASSNPNSKKGIQGIEFMDAESIDSIGVNHVLVNIDLSHCISSKGGQYAATVNGRTYYYTDSVTTYKSRIQQLNAEGVTVTAVLVMGWSTDSAVQELIYPARDNGAHTYYALNSYDSNAVNVLTNFYEYLLSQYSSSTCHIDNWIVGNEVNMPNAYNYTGTVNTTTNADLCAQSFVHFYNAMTRCGNANAKAYISLDHSWTHNDEGRGIAGKDFLNAFNTAINSKQANVSWNIAYHAYAAIMDSTASADTVLWFNRYTTGNENTAFVSGANLNVLTDYVKNHFGSNRRIILSEQGFDSRASQAEQAAAIAYTYYAAQNNSMIDAVIFRAYSDDDNDGAFKFGLLSGNMTTLHAALNAGGATLTSYISTNKKEAYNVFKYMDTSSSAQYVDSYLKLVGIDSWTDSVLIGANNNNVVDYQTVYNGRDYKAVYNKHYYLGDDDNAVLAHFVNYGMQEGRQAISDFNVYTYLDNYADLRSIFGNNLPAYYLHYIVSGQGEGRNGFRSTSVSKGVTIYRLYFPGNGEHLYTTDVNERNVLMTSNGWTYEGPAWTAPTSGTAVYRLYNPILKNHLYTTDTNEVNVLCAQYSWVKDNNGQPLFYSGGSKPIYRVYNEGLAGMHHLTTDLNEYTVLPSYGWKQEGISLYAVD